MKLSIKDRLILQGLLPTQGGLLTIALVQELQEQIRITSKEIEQVKMKETAGGITWDQTKEPAKAVELNLTKEIVTLLKYTANIADKEEKVTIENIDFIKRLLALPDKE